MYFSLLADLVVVIHGSFVLFVVFGGIAVLRWRRLVWLHLPAAVWGVLIELKGWICPLTYLENHFRRLGGEAGYGETFIGHYLEPLLYPLGLTRHGQVLIGLLALCLNVAIYACFWKSRRGSAKKTNGSA